MPRVSLIWGPLIDALRRGKYARLLKRNVERVAVSLERKRAPSKDALRERKTLGISSQQGRVDMTRFTILGRREFFGKAAGFLRRFAFLFPFFLPVFLDLLAAVLFVELEPRFLRDLIFRNFPWGIDGEVEAFVFLIDFADPTARAFRRVLPIDEHHELCEPLIAFGGTRIVPLESKRASDIRLVDAWRDPVVFAKDPQLIFPVLVEIPPTQVIPVGETDLTVRQRRPVGEGYAPRDFDLARLPTSGESRRET